MQKFWIIIFILTAPNSYAQSEPPLHQAVYEKDFELTKQLLKNGADTQQLDKIGRTALHKAFMHKTKETTKDILLIAAEGKVNPKKLQEMYGGNNLEIVKLLLKYGANVNAKDSRGWTSLHTAARFSSSAEVIKLLLKYGAKLEEPNGHGNTPLHTAAINPITAKILINAGAGLEIKDSHGNTPLHWAAGFPLNLQIFIDAGSNVNAISGNGETVLHAVANRGSLKGAEILIKAGVDITLKNRQGKTALEIARESGKDEITKYLQSLQ